MWNLDASPPLIRHFRFLSGLDATRLDGVASWSIAVSAGIIATTIHAQDFRDIDGDRTIGRKTIPIAFSNSAPWTVITPLIVWSAILSLFWNLDYIASVAFATLAAYVGMLFVTGKTVSEYVVAYHWYNVSSASACLSFTKLTFG